SREEELSALQREEDLKSGPTANKRLSAMGPKLKNSLALWELGADDDTEASGNTGGSFDPFAKRPSTDIRELDWADIRRAGSAAPATPAKDAVPTGSSSLASTFFGRPSRDYAWSQKHDASGVAMGAEFTDSTTPARAFHPLAMPRHRPPRSDPTARGRRPSPVRRRRVCSRGLGWARLRAGWGPADMRPACPWACRSRPTEDTWAASARPAPASAAARLSMPGSASSSMGKKSKLAKALRLGNRMSAASGGSGSGVQMNHHAPVGMCPSHPRESGSGLADDDSSIVSPTRPISNASHPHGSSSHQAPSLSTQQQQGDVRAALARVVLAPRRIAAPTQDGNWRKPGLLSPRTTSLDVSPPLSGGGVSTSVSTSSSSSSGLKSSSRTPMPTSPTATRLGSVGAPASSAVPRATDSLFLPLSSLPSSGVMQSDSELTITDPRGGLGGPERYASSPPVGADSQGHGLPGTAATGALGLTTCSSGGDHTEANANTSNDSSYPRPGQAEGLTYRLISLEEARANQAREREERNARSARGKAIGVGGGGAAGPVASHGLGLAAA
ncbi:hypothetical protein OC835_007784, partial [Tilletia horrida]